MEICSWIYEIVVVRVKGISVVHLLFGLSLLTAVVTVAFFVVLARLLFTKQERERLRELNQMNGKYLGLQKKYYEETLRQYEDMRCFRHDINNHIYILSQLSDEERYGELKKYIKDMAGIYKKLSGIHTGNFVADCIISRTLADFRDCEDFSFQMNGSFAEPFFMEDMDFCILLSNLLENAGEALKKVSGKRSLQIEVKRYKQWRYLMIGNSTVETVDFSKTDKKDKNSHGHGIPNIQRIVEKYGGSAVWYCEDGMAQVKMSWNLG